MELTVWDYSNLVSKWLIYIGVAAAVGGPFIAALIKPASQIKAVIEYVVLGIMLGIVAVIANFFIQVGAFAEAGFGGMFDGELIDLLWQSPVGDSVFWRLSGFTLLMLGLWITGRFTDKSRAGLQKMKGQLMAACYIFALPVLAYSFTFIGHNADIGGIAKWLIAFHVLALAWWIGALYPLWLSCRILEQKALYALMHLFGRLAMVIVGILLISGVSLLVMFMDSPAELITTPYGQLMLLKFLLVSAILLMAAWHKFHLVPAVHHGKKQDCQHLQKSISVEIWVAAVILAVTSVLSTVMGPANLA
ncbi:copper resistance D family protein [Thalassomonas actiniarum]|uniref:Copper resistance protein D n=1 Tax=Thalassomonas actiniarum TaxID=485447 RepID=A0AAF0C3T6_9GAMM|nr:CopD family protein [Thalassomonas actiniarum]WDD99054.1 CopD family protein [Thalassomonas actiniarum]